MKWNISRKKNVNWILKKGNISSGWNFKGVKFEIKLTVKADDSFTISAAVKLNTYQREPIQALHYKPKML